MSKQQLAARIWASANEMRSKIEASEYKDYILGFIFYMFLSEKLIKRAHELAFAEAEDPRTRGAYRTTEVEVAGARFDPAPAIYVPEQMESLVATCATSKRHPVVVSALFHIEFETIHPFVNANGRTGRLISNYILMAAGYEPVNIQAESRPAYIGSLRAYSEREDPYPFCDFYCQCILDRLERVRALLIAQPAAVRNHEVSGLSDYLKGVTPSPQATPPSWRTCGATVDSLWRRSLFSCRTDGASCSV